MLCLVLGVFVPCDRTVIHVIEDFSCMSFLRVFLAEVEVSVIVLIDSIGCAPFCFL